MGTLDVVVQQPGSSYVQGKPVALQNKVKRDFENERGLPEGTVFYNRVIFGRMHVGLFFFFFCQ